MDSERFVNVGRKLVAGICFILFVCVLLLGCRYRRVSHDLAEPARQRRSSTENAMFSTLNCTQQLFPMNETVEAIVDKLSDVTDDYVSLVRLNINNGNPPEQNDRVTWHWGLGARGRTMMYFPYDNRSLSLTTLSYGLHSVSISLNGDQLQNESVSDSCLVYSLSKLVQQVRLRVINSGGFSDDVEDDIICKEWFSDSCFAATKIPGYSIFELQASTYHECWNVNMTCVQGDCNMNRSFRIYCTFLRAAFGSTYVLLLLVLIGGLFHIYSKAYNYPDGVFADSVNILQINLIPPANLMFVPKCSKGSSDKQGHYKCLYMGYWIFLFIIPFVFYLGAFLWYVTGDEYAYRSDKRGNVYKNVFVWGLDFGLANILYIIGACIALDFIYKYRIENPKLCIEIPNNFESKKLKIAYCSGAFLLCFFRLSAAVMLLVEILILAVIGLAINIKYGSPIWINWIVGVLVCIANVIMFFDSYQHLFNMIYSVGAKVDRDGGFEKKIFESTNDGSMQFTIKSELLRNVIRKWLPFWNHIFKTFAYIFVGTVLLVGLASVIIFIDRIANVSSLVEYLITAFPLVIAAAVKFKGTSLTAGGKAKNRTQDKLLQLEEDFRKFAKNGNGYFSVKANFSIVLSGYIWVTMNKSNH